MSESKLREFMVKEWQLENILFVSGPPDVKILERVFTGRDNEIESAQIALVDAPFRLLINGLFGVGKTVFIKELKRKTKLDKKKNTLFVDEKMYSADTKIENAILRGLVSEMRSENEYAESLYRTLYGEEISVVTENNVGINFGLPIAGLRADGKIIETVGKFQKDILDPIPIIRRLISEAQSIESDRRIIISIDDLDRERDIEEVRNLLLGCRALLQDSLCSFILTSHPIGVTRDAYSSVGGIVDRHIHLKTFDQKTMLLMAARYLGAGRVKRRLSMKEPSFSEEQPTEKDLIPFTDESINAIIDRSFGIPRIFNIICTNILCEAMKLSIKRIGLEDLKKCWEPCRKSLIANVSPDMRKLLELLADKLDRINIDDIPDLVFDELHTDTRNELIKKLEFAIKSDLLVSRDGREFALTSILEPFEKRPLRPSLVEMVSMVDDISKV